VTSGRTFPSASAPSPIGSCPRHSRRSFARAIATPHAARRRRRRHAGRPRPMPPRRPAPRRGDRGDLTEHHQPNVSKPRHSLRCAAPACGSWGGPITPSCRGWWRSGTSTSAHCRRGLPARRCAVAGVDGAVVPPTGGAAGPRGDVEHPPRGVGEPMAHPRPAVAGRVPDALRGPRGAGEDPRDRARWPGDRRPDGRGPRCVGAGRGRRPGPGRGSRPGLGAAPGPHRPRVRDRGDAGDPADLLRDLHLRR